MNFKEDVYQYLNIDLSNEQLLQFEQYIQYLLEQNKNINLTAITDVHEIYYKHFFDSLLMCKVIDFNNIMNICDMGSGAGFPSIPIKIAFPHLKVTIIDALKKRINFLETLKTILKLNEVTLINDRIEVVAHQQLENFDLVTARALGSASMISEMGLPMTKIHGILMLLKGLNYENDLLSAKRAIGQCGGKIDKITTEVLPYDYGTRVMIELKKIKKVQGYPRSYQQIKNKPL
jgi:16S rRNA (guanine527-N7)-methyltransferase